MPQTQGAGTVMAGGPGSTERVPWFAKIATGINGVFNFLKVLDENGFQRESVVDNLVAHAGGGQANATLVTAQNARFTTVATIADSGKLPVSAPGLAITVINAAANSMNVFPQTGDQINALGANAAFALAGGKTAMFTCVSAGQWHAILSA